jgi:autotransporter-associated beta strand protein
MGLTTRGRVVLAAATLPVIWVGTNSANAAIQYWDLTGGVAGAGGATPTGAWGTATATWNAVTDGSGALANWTDGSDAVFSAGSDATGTYTVTTNTPVNPLSVTVEEGSVITSTTSANRVAIGTGGLTVNTGTKYSYNTTTSLIPATATTPNVNLNGGTLENRQQPNLSTWLNASFKVVLSGSGGTFRSPTDFATGGAFLYAPTVGVSGTGGLTITGGNNAQRWATAGSYTGPTTITALAGKTFEFRQNTVNNMLPTATDLTVNSGAVFNLGGADATVASLSGAGTIAYGAASKTLTVNGSSSTNFSGVIQDSFTTYGAPAGTFGRLTKSGSGVLTLSGVNTMTGRVTLTAGGITVAPTGKLSGGTADLIVNGGTLTLNNTAQTIENLSGSGGTISLGSGHVLTADPEAAAAGNSTYAGTITGAGSLTKANVLAGATLRTLTLTGDNNFAGATTINGGGLAASSASGQALGGTSSIAINGATSTLLLGTSNQVNNAAAMVLNAGKFDVNSQDETLGTLDVDATSTIDFGAGTDSLVHFADSDAVAWAGGAILNILNWSGSPAGGGTEGLFFGTDAGGLSNDQLGQIHFVDGAAPGGFYSAAILETGEVVAVVPEPAGAMMLLVGGAAYGLRRRRGN